ncbi:MAG: glycosyltransferase family A protein [Sulfurimicrobium sp.]|nr:glycosyltransferase family A protein [Sulfurimicrobium sp.]
MSNFPKDGAITRNPLVTIGIPIYNEERFLSQSLKSLLAQDYNNLKFIVSDNASTDGTERICREMLQLDGRIEYRRMECNQGAVANFRHALDLADGKYFMWASGHDLWQPNYVSECVKLLEREPEAVIAFGSSSWIDALGNPMLRTSGWTDTRGMDSIARFHSLLWGNVHPILGLIRMEALHKTRDLLNTAGTDLILLSELILQGHFVHAAETSWLRREFRGDENYQQRMARYSSREYALSRSFIDKLLPLLRLPVELVRSVLRSKISTSEKLLLLLSLTPVLPAKYLVTRNQQTRNKKT